MKATFLLFLLLFHSASMLLPPVAHVIMSPLSKTTYVQALKEKISTTPHVTFPLKKQQKRLVIPSLKGARVFRDGWIDGERDEETRYKYLGYWPALRWHLVEGYHFSEVYRLNVLTQGGQWLKLEGDPQLRGYPSRQLPLGHGDSRRVHPFGHALEAVSAPTARA